MELCALFILQQVMFFSIMFKIVIFCQSVGDCADHLKAQLENHIRNNLNMGKDLECF